MMVTCFSSASSSALKSRPGAQGNIHGGEIVWPDNADVGHRKIGERERRLAEKMDGGGRASPVSGGKLSMLAERTPGTGLILARSCRKKAMRNWSVPDFGSAPL